MSVKVTVDFNADNILKVRGLGKSNGARKHLASTVKELCTPYVPFQSGHLANSATISNDGSELVYLGPYAHYQYKGIVLGPNYTNGERFWSGKAPKEPTGKKLTYSGAPMRGAYWDKRMMADRKADVVKSVEAYIAEKRG